MQIGEMVLVGTVIASLLAMRFLGKSIAQRLGTEPLPSQKSWLYLTNGLGLIWLVAAALLNRAMIAENVDDPALMIAAIVAVFALGIAKIWSVSRYIREADEFMRRVEIESLALAFGMAIIGSVAVWHLTVAGFLTAAPPSDYFFLVVLPALILSRFTVLIRYR